MEKFPQIFGVIIVAIGCPCYQTEGPIPCNTFAHVSSCFGFTHQKQAGIARRLQQCPVSAAQQGIQQLRLELAYSCWINVALLRRSTMGAERWSRVPCLERTNERTSTRTSLRVQIWWEKLVSLHSCWRGVEVATRRNGIGHSKSRRNT